MSITEPGALKRSSPGEQQFRIFIETVRDYALLILDPNGVVTTWNAGAQAIKGWTADEIINRHFSTFYPQESIASSLPARELIGAERDGRYEDEGWRVKKDGSRFWANVVITALRDGGGRLTGFAKVTRDLTERRNHEESLRNSEERFRSLIDGVRDYAIFMLDPNGKVTTWNSGARQIMGYESAEILGTHLSHFYPRDGKQMELATLELSTATIQGRFEEEGWRLRKDGTHFWANVVVTAIRDAHGALMGFSKITRDLSERRKQESKLRASEERFRLLVESVIDYAILTVDETGFISSWNHGAERITGYRATEIIGRHVSHLYPSEDVSVHKPWQQLIQARDGQRVHEENWRTRKDGSLFWANCVISRLPSSDSALSNTFYVVMQDLTQRRHAESLADTAQKMHEFIAMLAHELRNPLAPIRNAVTLMKRRNIEDPVVEQMRATIERQGDQLARIIDELLDVNRVARGHFTVDKHPIDLREVLTRALETSKPLLDLKQHTIEIDLAAEPLMADADALRMQQVFVNLLNNAAKYTPAGGHVRVAARVLNGQVHVSVKDNGKGIPRDAIDRVFDLFAQLAPNAPSSMGGLGVGLALVRRIVELHGGRVWVKSAGVGAGSEFCVDIPLSQALMPALLEETELATITSRLRVLVVDDNVDAADSLGMLVQTLHQEVRTVYDGATALRELEVFKPHLVLLDVGMPHMSGFEVARAMRSSLVDPAPHIVAVTGWGQETDRARTKEAGFHRHLTKPVGEVEIRAVLAEVSDSAGPSLPRGHGLLAS